MGCGASSADGDATTLDDGNDGMTSAHQVVITVEQGMDSWLGMALLSGCRGSPLIITQVCDTGLIPDWNNQHPDKAVKAGDRIISVNGQGGVGAFATRQILHEFRK